MTQEEFNKAQRILDRIADIKAELSGFQEGITGRIIFQGKDYTKFYKSNVTNGVKPIFKKLKDALEKKLADKEAELAAL